MPTVWDWKKAPPRVCEHGHKLRKALASAIELHRARRWGREEIEAAGLRDYRAIFGHSIAPKTFWRLFDRTVQRDGGREDFSRLELYLPNAPTAHPATPSFEKAAKDFPELAHQVLAVQMLAAPTAEETILVWAAACGEWRRLNEAGAKPSVAQKLVLDALQASGLPLARTPAALRKTFKRKLERWIAGGYSPEALRDLRPRSSGRRQPLPLSEDDTRLLTGRALFGGLAKAWRESLNGGLLSSEVTQAYLGNPASKSYVPQRIRDLVGPDIKMLKPIHHGPRQAALNGAYISRDWSDVEPGDWYSADDTTLPLYYWDEASDDAPRVLRGQCLIMIDCRTSRILAFALHSERNYTAKVIRSLILRTHDSYGLPRRGFYFERGTWASAKLLKGASDEVPSDETELGLREWVEFKHAQPGNARAKTVERIIGLIQDRMEDQPGYCGRNEQVEKFERLQSKLLAVRAGKLHPREFLLHRDEWSQRLEEICDAYNHDPQEGRILRGLSPREAWEKLFDAGNPLMRLTGESRYLLANHRKPEKITRNGIRVQVGKERYWFSNELTGRLVGRIVQVYYDPEDMSSVFLKQSPHDTTAAVIPADKAIPAMTATRDQMREARGRVEAQNAPARTLYQEVRPYFKETGATPFRQVVPDAQSVQLAQEIAHDKEQIRAEQSRSTNSERQLAKLRRRFGTTRTQEAVSMESQRAGYELLKEAAEDAD